MPTPDELEKAFFQDAIETGKKSRDGIFDGFKYIGVLLAGVSVFAINKAFDPDYLGKRLDLRELSRYYSFLYSAGFCGTFLFLGFTLFLSPHVCSLHTTVSRLAALSQLKRDKQYWNVDRFLVKVGATLAVAALGCALWLGCYALRLNQKSKELAGKCPPLAAGCLPQTPAKRPDIEQPASSAPVAAPTPSSPRKSNSISPDTRPPASSLGTTRSRLRLQVDELQEHLLRTALVLDTDMCCSAFYSGSL